MNQAVQDIIVVEHRAMPAPDRGQTHLAARGFRVRIARPYAGEDLPDLDERTAGVILTGGPQFVTDLDRFPYLKTEMDFAERTMARGIPLLGICLGAQLMAGQMGARVDYHPENHVAFGYYEVTATDVGRESFPKGLHAPAGNIQGFDLPAGATLLATGSTFPNQAFRVDGNAYGFQFHPEVTRAILDLWQDVLADSYGKPGAQTRDEQDAAHTRHDQALDTWYTGFLDRLFGVPSG